MNKKSYNVIDLFCGCGGLSLGFEHAGYNLLLGIDMWKDALITYEHNHKNGNTYCADLAKLKAEDVEEKIGHQQVDVIIGGPPCQGFSIAGKRIVDDERNTCTSHSSGWLHTIFSQRLKKQVSKPYYEECFKPLENRQLIIPSKYNPNPEFLQWHRDVIFEH